MDEKEKYPTIERDERFTRLICEGCEIPDPYHWLEHPNLKETKKYMHKQNDLTRDYLDFPKKRALKQTIADWWCYPKELSPFKAGERYYQLKDRGTDDQFIMYTATSLEELPTTTDVFLDPNVCSANGSKILLNYVFSPNGKYLAYRMSRRGSEWSEIWFKDVDKRKDYKDTIKKVKFSELAWTPDSLGIFYSGYKEFSGSVNGDDDTILVGHKLYYHKMGTDYKDDMVVYKPSSDKSRVCAVISYSGEDLIMYVSLNLNQNSLHIGKVYEARTKTLHKSNLKCVMKDGNCFIRYITDFEGSMLFLTDYEAPNKKVVCIDLNQPDPSYWDIMVEHDDGDVLVSATPTTKNRLLLLYMRNVRHSLVVFECSSKKPLKEINLGLGAITNIAASPDQSEAFFIFSSLSDPGTIHKLQCDSPHVSGTVYKEIRIKNINPFNFVTKQIHITTKGNVLIPICIMHKKDFKNDGQRPCLLTAYAAFGKCLVYKFSVAHFFFVNCFNGIFIIANLFGGGEFGTNWHKSGRQQNKIATVDTFISIVKYCYKEKLTSSQNLIVEGKSMGGVLIAAALNKAPKLFGSVIIIDGMYDLLTFQSHTIGQAYVYEFGDPTNTHDFDILKKLSPYHNVITGTRIEYPPCLFVCLTNNDKIPAFHTLKFVTEVQRNCASKEPILLLVIDGEGQFYYRKSKVCIALYTEIFTYIIKSLRIAFNM